MSSTEMQQLLNQLNADKEGYIDYTNWLAAIVDWKQVKFSWNTLKTTCLMQLQECPVWDSWIHDVFELFDVEHRGALTKDELTRILCGEYCEVSHW